MSTTLQGTVRFANGRTAPTNYSDYRVTLMIEAPREIVVQVVPGPRQRPVGEQLKPAPTA